MNPEVFIKMQPYKKVVVLAMLAILPIGACYAKKPTDHPSNKPTTETETGTDTDTDVDTDTDTDETDDTTSELVDLNNQTYITLHPTALTGPVANPGMGVETFHDNWGAILNSSEYPDAGIDYYRFYWDELEPEEGQYAFDVIDKLLSENRNETLPKMVAIRFMTADEPETGSKIPQWLIDKGISGYWTDDHKTFVPDLNDSLYLYYGEKLLKAFGKRHDGNSNLSHIDIGMVGSWGEWHNSNFTGLESLDQKYSDDELNKWVDLHFEAFPKTPKVMLISGGNSLAYATQKGAGWRVDCWGDWHHFSTTWSHMNDDYPYRIEQAQQADPNFDTSWQRGPVSLETCGTMQGWSESQGYTYDEVKATMDWAIEHHASTLNLKSKPIPEEYRPLLDEALTKIGYRLRLDTLNHQVELNAGGILNVNAVFVNEGIAPPYQHRYLAYRLIDENGDTAFLGSSHYDVREWLPGKHETHSSMTLPADIPAGHYYLELALVDSHGDARLNFANVGKQESGWYRFSDLTIM